MIEVIVLIIWACLAPVVDGLIYPELFHNNFSRGIPLWVYLGYWGIALVLGLWVYYKWILGEVNR